VRTLSLSELLFDEAVSEEKESGTSIILVLLVGEAHAGLHVVTLSGVVLELIGLSGDEFDHIGGTLLEVGNAVLFAGLLQLGDHGFEEALGVGHEILLGEGDFLELECVGEVNNGLELTIVIGNIIRRNADLIVSLLSIFGFDLVSNVVIAQFVGVGIREHLVSADKVFEHFHDC
jgi:hypothetical protein